MTGSSMFRMVSSWWTTFVLVLVLTICYLVFLFGDSPWEAWTGFIFRSPFGLVLYWGLAINILSASLRILLAAFSKKFPEPDAVRSMDLYKGLPAKKFDDLADLLRSEGLSVRKEGTKIHATAARYSVLPGTMTRAGLVLFLAAAFAGSYTMKSVEKVIHEGDEIKAFGSQAVLKSVSADMPSNFLQLEEEGSFLLKSVSAELISGGSSRTITAGFPTRIDGVWYRIRHLGISQPATFQGKGIGAKEVLDLDILPPGKADIVALPLQELFLTVSLAPERTINKGLVKAKEYDLSAMNYRMVFQRGEAKEKIGEMNVKEGTSASAAGLSVSLGRHAAFIKVQAVSDPALPFAYAGSLLTFTGMVLMLSRFFWYRKELYAIIDGDVLHIGYREEFFRKWASVKFHRWTGDLHGEVGE